MGSLLGKVDWIGRSGLLEKLLEEQDGLVIQTLDQGFEAEVMKIVSGRESFVLKLWNKSSRPDIRTQFLLLKELFERGIAVSEPLGWGIDTNGDQVLLTTFDGTPVKKVNARKLAVLADMLAKLHQIKVEDLQGTHLPANDFMKYFFPGVEEYADISRLLIPLVQKAQMKQESIIHGDFHMNNIVEKNGRYTVIDWTNGQTGDPGYDFAWSVVLLSVYISEPYAAAFRSAYLQRYNIGPEKLKIYEALAVLRWRLLQRSGGVPVKQDTFQRITSIAEHNPFLQG
ncbi:aminoglycoside phosphotransferase family protein [Paenibacillus pedocola]|uniref:aminoglycoside phosphotransferase family protein n=1 Tax=Paenibacillus pedocola TaxID=3242193 RepID=UPI002877C20E|nr:aminoglycoside phosphotransferase family protein [Paenibacillus typhae]